jgi:hypothetical protein
MTSSHRGERTFKVCHSYLQMPLKSLLIGASNADFWPLLIAPIPTARDVSSMRKPGLRFENESQDLWYLSRHCVCPIQCEHFEDHDSIGVDWPRQKNLHFS